MKKYKLPIKTRIFVRPVDLTYAVQTQFSMSWSELWTTKAAYYTEDELQEDGLDWFFIGREVVGEKDILVRKIDLIEI